jgi:hypothetical protein
MIATLCRDLHSLGVYFPPNFTSAFPLLAFDEADSSEEIFIQPTINYKLIIVRNADIIKALYKLKHNIT